MSEGDDNHENERSEPRIRNLKGLLKFCMDHTKEEDAGVVEMSEDRKKWLEEALTSMTVNPVQRMAECLKIIEQVEPDTEEGTVEQIAALTELEDWVEDLDNAKDFVKIKGLRIVPVLLGSAVSELRWRCLELLAHSTQNNPFVQEAVLSIKLLGPLLLLVDQDPNPTVRVKALYALSCLVRNHVTAQSQLISSDGLAVLVKAMQSDEEKCRIKSSFIITNMCSFNPAVKDDLLKAGAVEQVIKTLKTEHNASHEYLLSALCVLVTDNKKCKDMCWEERFHLKDFLTERIQFLEGKEEFEEEREHANHLLTLLESGDQPTGEPSSNLQVSTQLRLQ